MKSLPKKPWNKLEHIEDPKAKLLACAETMLPYLENAANKEAATTILLTEDYTLNRHTISMFNAVSGKPWIKSPYFGALIKNTHRYKAADRAFRRLFEFYLVYINYTSQTYSYEIPEEYRRILLLQDIARSAERYVNYLKKWQKRQQNQTSSLS